MEEIEKKLVLDHFKVIIEGVGIQANCQNMCMPCQSADLQLLTLASDASFLPV